VRAKQRSVHNNYLTLPVVFTMLAGHFPLAYGSDHPWLVLVTVFGLLAVTRHFFNLWHTGRRVWWVPAAVGAAAVALALALAPEDVEPIRSGATQAPTDAEALAITAARCQTCHSGAAAPAGVRLESVEQLRENAAGIQRQVSANAMPPGNATGMTTAEREILIAWAVGAR
jgi:uncharacterized membrane protein